MQPSTHACAHIARPRENSHLEICILCLNSVLPVKLSVGTATAFVKVVTLNAAPERVCPNSKELALWEGKAGPYFYVHHEETLFRLVISLKKDASYCSTSHFFFLFCINFLHKSFYLCKIKAYP